MGVLPDTHVDGGKTSGATSLQWNHTVSPGLTNSGLVVALDSSAAALASPTSVVWDSGGANTPLTSQGTASESLSNARSEHWGLIAPATGTKAIKITFAATRQITAGSLSVQYADQTNLFRSASNSNTGSTGPTSLSVNTAAGDLVVGSIVDNEPSSNDALTQSFGTTIHNDAVGAGLESGASAYVAAVAATQTVVFGGVTSGNTWAQLGSSIKWDGVNPATSYTPPPPYALDVRRNPLARARRNLAMYATTPPAASVNTYTYAGSGGLQSGGAAPVQVLFVPRPTGGLQSGGHAPLVFIAIPTPGGGLQSGGIAPSSLTKSFVASGGLQSGGHAPMTFTAAPRATGGLHSAGSAPMSAQLVHRPSGGLNASGTAPKLFILSVRPSGGLNASGAASAVFIPGGQPQQTRSTTMWIGMGIRV